MASRSLRFLDHDQRPFLSVREQYQEDNTKLEPPHQCPEQVLWRVCLSELQAEGCQRMRRRRERFRFSSVPSSWRRRQRVLVEAPAEDGLEMVERKVEETSPPPSQSLFLSSLQQPSKTHTQNNFSFSKQTPNQSTCLPLRFPRPTSTPTALSCK
ncbi:hypothetical protein N658DRAFT_234199 [Parathielavia hyrcaniae]|uniref:Uncharacterized protein n=1 Tax=Parathielavia hyrcaniae TaxID=113614 RepID=A0AAN6Q8V6_9PEZI|nr:hypothetical protein N658DRAFT_234199 [Parathielavia hyrcaniae]